MTKPDEDFADLLKEFDARDGGGKKKRRDVEPGDVIRGRIVSIGRESVFISLGAGKSEGSLDLNELRDADGNVTAKVGDEIEARVVEAGGESGAVVLRRSLRPGAEGKAELSQAHQLRIPVEGTITAVNKGGLDVMVAGVRGFCPVSQLELRHVDDPSSYIGRKLTFLITKYEEDRRGINMVVSRRALLEAEGRDRRAKLVVGAVLPGVVTTLKEFGAFVDLGGVEGMLHVSEIGYQRDTRPADHLAVGQRLQVQVIKIDNERISLSLKSLERDPWEDVATRFAPGTKVKGKVMRVEAFGAFVELEPGVDGLLHVEELAAGRQTRHARELAKPGDLLEVTVLSVDQERRRISLGVGDRPDAVDPADLQAHMTGGSKLGTLGDLFRQQKKP